MVEQVVDVPEASLPSEGGPPSVWPAPVKNEAVWNQSAAKDSWQKIENNVPLIVTNQELLAWEKTQKTPEGKDALRGVKLKARLDGVIASRNPGAVPDATGTP